MKWYFYHSKKLREFMNSRMLKAVPPSPAPATAQEQALIDQLRSDFSEIGPVNNEAGTPSEQVWVNNMNRLTKLVMEEDPRGFLHWDVIQKAMFITNAMYVLMELAFLKKQPNWKKRWEPAISEDPTGSPLPYWTQRSSSGNLIHHGYHIAQFEAQTGADVSILDFVVECGGGYGSMCRLFRNLGFTGEYIIFDLPHFSALQKYYLQSLGISLSPGDKGGNGMTVRLCSDLDAFKEVVGEKSVVDRSLLLATWSLSEMPLSLRAELTPMFRNFQYLFFAYQSVFEEVDNVEYFAELGREEPGFTWKSWEVEPLPTHYYMAGSRV